MGQPTHCDICGERFKETDEIGEFYNPEEELMLTEMNLNHYIAHAQCGINKGYDLA